MIDDWISRLSNALDVDVHGAADLDAAKVNAQRDAVYVLLVGDQASDNQLIGAVRQQTITTMGIVMAITNRRSRRGEGNMDELEQRRNQVRATLLGWEPAGLEGQVTYSRGRLLGFGDGTLWWQDEYLVDGMISAVN